MKNYLQKKWQTWRGTILFITCVVLPVRSSIAALNFVPTGSMNPTILEGDFVLANHLSYGLRIPMTDFRVAQWDDPERGDVVICFVICESSSMGRPWSMGRLMQRSWLK